MTKPTVKQLVKSKTLLLNGGATTLLSGLAAVGVTVAPQIYIGLLGLNFLLRFFTKKPLNKK